MKGSVLSQGSHIHGELSDEAGAKKRSLPAAGESVCHHSSWLETLWECKMLMLDTGSHYAGGPYQHTSEGWSW